MRHRSLAPLLLTTVATVAIAACSGSGGSSAPSSSAAPSVASEAPASQAPASAAPSDAASGAPSAAPSGSAEGTQVEVVGTDYAYSGLEASYSGPITITFRNDGQEVHEIVVVRKNEGVTQSWEELLALPEDESMSLVSFAGVAFAAPGETAPETVTAAEPGEYLAICFVPQGTTEMPSMDPNASGPPELGTGAPHFTLGMLSEFTIAQ